MTTYYIDPWATLEKVRLDHQAYFNAHDPDRIAGQFYGHQSVLAIDTQHYEGKGQIREFYKELFSSCKYHEEQIPKLSLTTIGIATGSGGILTQQGTGNLYLYEYIAERFGRELKLVKILVEYCLTYKIIMNCNQTINANTPWPLIQQFIVSKMPPQIINISHSR